MLLQLLKLLPLLLPVLAFLGVLVYFDSFKLLRGKLLVGLTFLGIASALASYYANTAIYNGMEVAFVVYSRFVAPWVEESLKALPLVYLLRSRKLGLPIDAAIAGFAVGAGFALLENAFYLHMRPDLSAIAIILRGFSTAVMHGGATAVFGMVAVALADRSPHGGLWLLLPALAAAAILHGTYNLLLAWPVLAVALVLVVLPLVFRWVFKASEQHLRDWLESGLDANAELLRMINRGELLSSPLGRHFTLLRSHFEGEALGDMLCVLRVHAELSMRAKGLLVMKEMGLEVELDEETRSRMQELQMLENSLGPTGMLAIRPLLAVTGKDLWQLQLLAAK
jgi:RsiW-degrading membrane proteinase PrsW (M82 family)